MLLADQDDVRHPDKIERLLERMRLAEASASRPSPQLVYSDLTVVDAGLRTVHPSFLRYARLRHGEGRPLRTLLGRCFVLGCASIVNRPLLEFALPLPESVASHDWWLALSAAAVGQVSFLPESTLDYRRHGKNTSGPAGFWQGFNPLRHSWRRRWEVGRRSFQRSLDQARRCGSGSMSDPRTTRRKRPICWTVFAACSSGRAAAGGESSPCTGWAFRPSTCPASSSTTSAC